MASKSMVAVILALVLLGGTACTYRGTLKEDFYHVQNEAGQKYPYKIGVSVDERAKSISFRVLGNWVMDLNLYAALGKALQQELQTRFESVHVVQDKSKLQEYDLVVSADINMSEGTWIGDLGGSGEGVGINVQTKVGLTFKDLRAGVTLAKESHERKIFWKQSSLSATCMLLTLFPPGILLPITVPCMKNEDGDAILEALEKQLPDLIRDIVADAQGDARVTAYVKRGTSGRI